MNEIIIKNWNETVSSDDTVLILGDFAMAARAVEHIVPRLNGKKILILGNHDFPHPAHQKGRKPELRDKWTKLYLDWGFAEVKLQDTLEVPGVATFNLHHIPYATGYGAADEEGRERKVQKYAAHDDGRPLLCGHVHEKWGVRRASTGSIMINVGVDSPGMPWSGKFRPASLDEIVQVFKEASCSDS
jgi:calcineurin-like phosphoesterase family protein